MLGLVVPMLKKMAIRAVKEDVTVKLIGIFKHLIADGTLAPGGKLPAERELAESFGVSRSSLRQALKVLEIMSVISQRVGDGTYLNTGASSILAESMEFLILLNGISFDELMEARLIVEPELAARAAERATDQQIASIGRELDSMRASGGQRLLVHHDLLFHQAIFQAAGNRLCAQMFAVVHRSLEQLMGMTAQIVDASHTVNLHRRIYRAIARRDGSEARQRTLEHLLDARELLTRAVDRAKQNAVQNKIAMLVPRGAPAGAGRKRARR